jgi:3-phosphoshikimate 1-carboxyvinyltransferase
MIRLSHPTGILKGSVHLPSSKSISNRLLVLKRILMPDLRLRNLSKANDTELLKQILQNLDKLTVVNAQDAGTAFRFLTAVLAITKGGHVLMGEKRMNERPIKELVDALNKLGADLEYMEKEGFPPLKIKGQKISDHGILDLTTVRSSQFISALLLIAHSVKARWTIRIDPQMNSKPFVTLTVNLLNALGAETLLKANTIEIGQFEPIRNEMFIEPDWTSFYYFLGMAIQAKEVDLFFPGLSLNSVQEESMYWESLNLKGIGLEEVEMGVRLFKDGDVCLGNTEYDFTSFPDLWPTMAFSLAGSQKQFAAKGLSWLKYKESDRLKAVLEEFSKMGIIHHQMSNSVQIDARNLNTPLQHIVQTYEDHRMAMSAAILGVENQIRIETPEVVNKSFPNFWMELEKIGFNIEKV